MAEFTSKRDTSELGSLNLDELHARDDRTKSKMVRSGSMFSNGIATAIETSGGLRYNKPADGHIISRLWNAWLDDELCFIDDLPAPAVEDDGFFGLGDDVDVHITLRAGNLSLVVWSSGVVTGRESIERVDHKTQMSYTVTVKGASSSQENFSFEHGSFGIRKPKNAD